MLFLYCYFSILLFVHLVEYLIYLFLILTFFYLVFVHTHAIFSYFLHPIEIADSLMISFPLHSIHYRISISLFSLFTFPTVFISCILNFIIIITTIIIVNFIFIIISIVIVTNVLIVVIILIITIILVTIIIMSIPSHSHSFLFLHLGTALFNPTSPIPSYQLHLSPHPLISFILSFSLSSITSLTSLPIHLTSTFSLP